MHEKVQLERLLDNLQGPDWLKVMGITGVTDGERKEWEPKRDFFIKEVELLVDKFRLWKEQEKKLKVEKEAAQAVKEDDDDEEETESGMHIRPIRCTQAKLMCLQSLNQRGLTEGLPHHSHLKRRSQRPPNLENLPSLTATFFPQYPSNLQSLSHPSSPNHIFELLHWGSTDMDGTPSPSACPSRSSRSVNSSYPRTL